MPPQTAAALVIGNELLTGKIADANTAVLATTLREIGVRLERVLLVLDDRAVIAAEVRALSEAYDVVFTSGGVGPTHDDVTIDAVADAFGVATENAPALEAMLRSYYGDAIKEGHLHMARAPVGAKLVVSTHMPWPTIVMRNVWVLPGVPQIFAMKMAVVRQELGGGLAVLSIALHTQLDEGNLKPHLDAVVAAYPDVAIGSYPKWRDDRYRTKVTFDGSDRARLDTARDALRAALPEDTIVDVDA